MRLEDVFTIAVLFIAATVMVFIVSLFIVDALALPENTTDWNFGGIELWDDDKEEQEELEDEKQHQEESESWDEERK